MKKKKNLLCFRLDFAGSQWTFTHTPTHTEQASEVLRDYTHPIITYTVRPHEYPTTTESKTHEHAPQMRTKENSFQFSHNSMGFHTLKL